ncbi:MAG: 3-phosphoshikimate 1-carboxyvinyltransferase [Gammaproteobacteria bacterium]|nr:3-phosphoshikimate 1-carboxyvinyltransferase [Gammaproteobacteria bacterium]MCD8543171.1 3-phosphoshikimate 1-carboxyvinyltransferase [Gammaproteobacteria bacterium]
MLMEIQTLRQPVSRTISIPGSKSITNRCLLLAALAKGNSCLHNVLLSDDTDALMKNLSRLGVSLAIDRANHSVRIQGVEGIFPQKSTYLDCHDSGTVLRFLLPACGNQDGEFYFHGSSQLQKRPIQQLLDVLIQQGACISDQRLPLKINNTQRLRGGKITIFGGTSSQFLSGLLMSAPYYQQDSVFKTHDLVSEPYIRMTCAMMRQFGVFIDQRSDKTWHVRSAQTYLARNYWIEPDFSSASYFFAAAAVTNSTITILNLSRRKSLQGDKAFLDILEKMGCTIIDDENNIRVIGPKQLQGVDADMRDCSDTMMTLAAIAPFAQSPTRISNIGHVRVKESDRITAIVANLRALNIHVEEEETAITIYPSTPRGTTISSYHDHRIAMACSIIGLKVPNIIIQDPECISKTFPNFFEKLSLI